MDIRKRVTQEPEANSKVFFENLRKYIRPQDVVDMFGISMDTVYDWRYRPHRRNTPEGLFVKFNGQLYLHSKVLESWISSQNS